MHDLEIRGAGEVLGENQSGNMMEVGFQLYNDMLAEAVRALKAGREPDLLSPLSVPPPRSTCTPRPAARRLLRRRAHAAESVQAPGHGRQARADRRLLEEITDRFGKLPAQGQTLFDTHRLRVLAKPYGVLKIDAGPKLMNIELSRQPTDRRAPHHRTGAEEPRDQAGRQRQAAHRARDREITSATGSDAVRRSPGRGSKRHCSSAVRHAPGGAGP
jgi:transcription-repair coupling factor (superfamily II helicase)